MRDEREIVAEGKNKPELDEQTFEKLLEAAYVIQEHNRQMGRPKPYPAAASEEEQMPAIAFPAGADASDTPPDSCCRRCGGNLVASEKFCGNCGAPRAYDSEPTLQSKVASAWHMQQARQQTTSEASDRETLTPWEPPVVAQIAAPGPVADEEDGQPDSLLAPGMHDDRHHPELSISTTAGENALQDLEATTLARLREDDMTWSSASRARAFLEGLRGKGSSSALAHFWRNHRGDFYLAVAIVLLGVAIRWGILSQDAAGGAGRGTAISANTNRPDADLSAFDKILISLGLAEAPAVPAYKGNPQTQVWIDLHTALYYCPGSELYGTTPKGKYASQRDAQLDQFEPASRKACN